MLTNHSTITVFCSRKIGREKLWFCRQLENVNFHGTDQLLVGDKEVTRSDEYVIRIPEAVLQQNGYVDKATWKSLPEDELNNYFTVQKGDYIVKGIVDGGVASSADIIKNYEALEITSIVENFSASKYSRHIKVVVK